MHDPWSRRCRRCRRCEGDEEAKGEEKRKADISAIANQESLSILEVEMRKLEAVTKEIVDELGYLQRREMRMRDTNGESFFLSATFSPLLWLVQCLEVFSRYDADEVESTNDRVKTFSILIMVGIIGLGAWQVRLFLFLPLLYLFHPFRRRCMQEG